MTILSCRNCQSPQFLNIISSRVYFDGGIVELEKTVECTMCGGEGAYYHDYANGYMRLVGDLEEIETHPKA